MTADSGASCKVIDERTYANKFKCVKLDMCQGKMNAHGGTPMSQKMSQYMCVWYKEC